MTDQNFSLDEVIDLASKAEVMTLDTEGVSRMLGFSLGMDGLEKGLYFPLTHIGVGNATLSQQDKMRKVLASCGALVFHNSPHDLRVLSRNGWAYSGTFFDTMLMQHWLNEELMKYSLDYVSKMYGFEGKAMPWQMSAIIEMDGWDMVPASLMTEYSGNDAYITHGVFRKIEPKFWAEFTPELWEVEQKFIRQVMIPMMELGVRIDTKFCMTEYLKGTEIMAQCRAELGMNPASGKQLEQLLIKELGLPVLKHTDSCKECKYKKRPVNTHRGTPSFSKDVMDEYDKLLERKNDRRAQLILRYRGWQKVTSSSYKPYMELCDENQVLHPSYNLHRTRTSRLSCSDPNLQQIPKSSDKEWNGNSKAAFIPRDGYRLWTIDYSQLQYRMAVAAAGEQSLIDIFNDPKRDIFQEQGNQMSWKRDDVKTLVYLTLFGGGGKRASEAFGVTINKGRKLVNDYYSHYPKLRAISNKAAAAAERQGYVRYWTGRRRHFFKGGAPTYRAFNAYIQGGEAEIVKRAMIALMEEVCNDECRLVLQIHDEVALEIKEGKEDEYLPRAQKVMERVPEQYCEAVGRHVDFRTSAKPWGEK